MESGNCELRNAEGGLRIAELVFSGSAVCEYRPHAAVVAFDERSLNMVIGSCRGPTATFENFKPMTHFRRLLERGFSIPKDWNEGITSNSARVSRADPARNDVYVSPENAG